jgi:multidrug efflux system membrane fusion protein
MDDTVTGVKLASALEPDPAPGQPRRRGWIKWAVAVALALIAVLAFQHYEDIAPSTEDSRGGGKPAGPPAQSVGAATIAAGDIPITISALGTVTPLATVTIRTQISGQLQQIGFTEGQIVKAGDFLAQIDPRPYQATLAQAQGQLAKDTALYAQAQADLARYQTLNKQDSISHQQVDDQAYLVQQYKAAMASDQAQIDAANLNINYCRILSPVGGRVGLRQVDAGNYVQSSDANGIVVITQIQPISVVFSTPEDNLPEIMARMKVDNALPVTVLDRANVKQLATGSLTTIDNQIDTSTGTVKLRATFANDDGALFPQQFVNVVLLVDTLKGAVVAPNAAIQQGAPGSFVYLIKDDGTVTVRKVKVGPTANGMTAVTSGLEIGDKVVIDGADRLRDGAKVAIAAPPGAAAAEPAGGAASGGHQHRRRKDQPGAAGSEPAAPSGGPPAP